MWLLLFIKISVADLFSLHIYNKLWIWKNSNALAQCETFIMMFVWNTWICYASILIKTISKVQHPSTRLNCEKCISYFFAIRFSFLFSIVFFFFVVLLYLAHFSLRSQKETYSFKRNCIRSTYMYNEMWSVWRSKLSVVLLHGNKIAVTVELIYFYDFISNTLAKLYYNPIWKFGVIFLSFFFLYCHFSYEFRFSVVFIWFGGRR